MALPNEICIFRLLPHFHPPDNEKRMKINLLALILLLLSCQSFAQTYTGNQKQIDIILKNIAQFSADVMSGEHKKIGAAYTKNAKIFPNNLDIISGRSAIAKYWKLPEGVSITYHKVTPSEIKITGKEAYDYGYYEGKTMTKGEESSWKGKYVIIWKKVGKDWKIYLDIWNRIKE